MRKMTDLNAALVFAEVAKVSSFSAAARKLKMPISTVSDRVAALEAELGIKLLARTTRQVRVTDAGLELLGGIEPALAALVSAAEAASNRHAAPSGTLRISVPADFSLDPVAKALIEYKRKCPRVSVEVSLSNRYVDLVREGFDLAIRGGELDDSGYIAKRIGRGCLVLVASPGYLRQHGAPGQIEDVTSHPCVEFSNGDGVTARTVWDLRSTEGRKVRLHPARSLSLNSFGLVAGVARQGYGIAFIPESLILRELAECTLERVLPEWSSKPLPVHLVYPVHHQKAPKVREMVAILGKHLEGAFGGG
jgi:DNA-binding transcriptional LysR family regulator